MKLHSLENLAWISRCLFPVDFYKELIKLGVDKDIAFALSSFASVAPNQRPKNILNVYQDCLGSTIEKELIEVIEMYIENFLKK